MQKFIYVFNKEDRDVLLSNQYHLVKSDDTKGIYIFLNKESIEFSLECGMHGIAHVMTDILTF